MRRLLGLFLVPLVGISLSDAKEQLLNCKTLKAVDGDSIYCNGIDMRDMGDGAPFVSGYDTPEIWNHKCPEELALAKKAKKRMEQLLRTPGVRVIDSGEVDKTSKHRPLVWVKLPNSRSIGSILIEETLARRWTPYYIADWCPKKK